MLAGNDCLLFQFRLASIASRYMQYILLCHRAQCNVPSDIHMVLSNCDYGDWFILMQLARHVFSSDFRELIIDLRFKMAKNYEINRGDYLMQE